MKYLFTFLLIFIEEISAGGNKNKSGRRKSRNQTDVPVEDVVINQPAKVLPKPTNIKQHSLESASQEPSNDSADVPNSTFKNAFSLVIETSSDLPLKPLNSIDSENRESSESSSVSLFDILLFNCQLREETNRNNIQSDTFMSKDTSTSKNYDKHSPRINPSKTSNFSKLETIHESDSNLLSLNSAYESHHMENLIKDSLKDVEQKRCRNSNSSTPYFEMSESFIEDIYPEADESFPDSTCNFSTIENLEDINNTSSQRAYELFPQTSLKSSVLLCDCEEYPTPILGNTSDKITCSVVPPVKNLFKDYLQSNQNIFDDQTQSATLTLREYNQTTTNSGNVSNESFVSALKKNEHLKNIEGFCDYLIRESTKRKFVFKQPLKYFIADSIYRQKASHICESFLPFNLNINELEINKYNYKNERLLSISEQDSVLFKEIHEKFIITPFSFNSLDYTQIFQVETLFNSLKDFLAANKDCMSKLNVKNGKNIFIYLENLMKSSCSRENFHSFYNFNTAKLSPKSNKNPEIFNQKSSPGTACEETFSNKDISPENESIKTDKSSKAEELNDFILVNSDSFESESHSDDASVIFSVKQNDEFVYGSQSFIFYIQYICEFIESAFSPHDDELPNEYSPRILLLKLFKISTIVYEALYGDRVILDRTEYNHTDEFHQLMSTNSDIQILSDRLENELINFMLAYRYIYREYYHHYLNQYLTDRIVATEKFRIVVVLMDTLMNMLTLVCNFRNIYLNSPLKIYKLDYNFIENSQVTVFDNPKEKGIFIKNLKFDKTGILQDSSSCHSLFIKLLISYAKLVQLPVNFIKSCKSTPTFDVKNFETLRKKYFESQRFKSSPAIDRPSMITEFLRSANDYISAQLELKNSSTIGSDMWIERYSCALFDHFKNLDSSQRSTDLDFTDL